MRYLLLLVSVLILVTACGGDDGDDGTAETVEPTNTSVPAAANSPTSEPIQTLPPTATVPPTEAEAEPPADPLTTPGMTKGDPHAPVHLIEYGDFQ